MKKLLLLLVCLSIIPIGNVHAQGKWRRILNAATFDIAINHKNYNTIYTGGANRLFYRSYDGGLHWDTVMIGGFAGTSQRYNNVFSNPIDTNVLLVGGLSAQVIRRSDDGGNTWKIVLMDENNPISLNGKAMDIDPVNPNIYYLGEWESATIYKSTNMGLSWDSISIIKDKKRVLNNKGEYVDSLWQVSLASLSIRQDSNNVIVAGTTTGDIFVSQDYGLTWAKTDSLKYNGSRPYDNGDNELTRIAFSDRNPRVGYISVTYVQYGNLPNGGIWKTTDGGYHWSLMGFQDTSFWAVAARKYTNDLDEVYIGGYVEDYANPEKYRVPGWGMVRSTNDDGKTWWNYDSEISWWDPSVSLRAVRFYKNKMGYICGDIGTRMFSDTKANTWVQGFNITNQNLNSVFAVKDSIAFQAGNGGVILKTIDGGMKWNVMNSNHIYDLFSINFPQINKGFACGDNGAILFSSDTGATWTRMYSPVNLPLYKMEFLNDFGIAVGYHGTIIKTSDMGTNWNKIESGITTTLKGVAIIDTNNLIAVGENGSIYRTNNGGAKWNLINSGTNVNINSVVFIDKNNGIAVGDYSTVLRTKDGGQTWDISKIDPYCNLYDVSLCRGDSVFAVIVGSAQTVMVSKDSGNYFQRIMTYWGPAAKVWSLRYLGQPGAEKLYMATEAGLFVLDNPQSVNTISNIDKSSRLNVIVGKDKVLNYTYISNKLDNNSSIIVNVYDLRGSLIKSRHIDNNTGNNLMGTIDLQNCPVGSYILEVIEGNSKESKLFILN